MAILSNGNQIKTATGIVDAAFATASAFTSVNVNVGGKNVYAMAKCWPKTIFLGVFVWPRARVCVYWHFGLHLLFALQIDLHRNPAFIWRDICHPYVQ